MNDSNRFRSEDQPKNLKEGQPSRGCDRQASADAPRSGDFNPRSIYDIQRKWQKRGAEVRLVVTFEPDKPPHLEIDFISIPKASRCKGYGSKLMSELLRAADFGKMDVALTPEKSERSERSRKFFERHGFRPANGEDGPFTWMVRKTFRRERPKSVPPQAPQKKVEKPQGTSLFMEKARKFKEGDKGALSDYRSSGKVGYNASGSKSSYETLAAKRRPSPPTDIPEGHFVSWNEEKKAYEFLPKKRACGGVVFNDRDEILLCMPSHSNGYVWTFPTAIADGEESPEEVAKRGVEERTGVKAQILAEIPGSFEDELTDAHFFTMRVLSADRRAKTETAQIAWVKAGEVSAYLSQSTSERGRKRDALLFEAALRFLTEAFEKKVSDSFARFMKSLPERSLPEERLTHEDRSAGEEEASVSGNGLVEEERDDRIGATDIEHALIYWGRKEHRAKYSAREQREIMAQLLRAAQKHGLGPESLKL